MQEQPSESLQRITLTMVLLNAFTTPLMLSGVNVALPAIAIDLSMNAVLLSWIPMAYLMASAMFVLIFGRLADMVGRKRIFLIGTGSVIVTSLIAAFAVSGTMLVAARFLQGMSAAMLYATQVAIVSSVFPPAKRGRAIGLTVSTIYLGLTIGPLLGGFVIDAFGWRASFLLHIPLAFVVLLLGVFYVKGDWSSDERGSFDLFGALTYIVSILIICIAVSYLPSTLSLFLLALSLFGFAFFFLFEKVHKHPIFNVTLFFTNRIFTFSCLASLIIYTATFANVVQVSLYLQYLKEMSAASAGMIMMCQPLTMAIFSPLAGRLSDKIEARYLATAGMAVSCGGLLLLSNLQVDSSLDYLLGALVITGFGFSLFSSPNVNAIMGSVEKRSLGSANGVMATMRIFGQMTSMVLVTLVFALIIGPVEIDVSNYDALEKAIRLTFSIAACLCLPGLYFSVARGK
ncbi:MAG: MFS transporter [Proteobacteria bacterium]|nr:MFS transporter [Pseudomonadota bacterium]NOG61276.1 MFS transporter [Pseudomonadota bacterium]